MQTLLDSLFNRTHLVECFGLLEQLLKVFENSQIFEKHQNLIGYISQLFKRVQSFEKHFYALKIFEKQFKSVEISLKIKL